METKLPDLLLNYLKNQYASEDLQKIEKGFLCKRKTTFRVNNLKTNCEKVLKEMQEKNIKVKKIDGFLNAFIVEEELQDISKLDCFKNGEIYVQSLSSMLPVFVLNPQKNTDVLDMCASPGGKTSLIASVCENKINIMACELNKARYERLKYNLEKLGVKNVNLKQINSLHLDDYYKFDQILLDVPCSGTGTICLKNEKPYTFLNQEINRINKTQYALLEKAFKMLKKNQTMVYSTCSILKQENQDIIEKFLKTHNAEIEPINIENFTNLPLLKNSLKGTICVCPTDIYEGFFIAKIKKIG